MLLNMKLIQHKLKRLLELNLQMEINNQKRSGLHNKQMENINIKYINRMDNCYMKIKVNQQELDYQQKDQIIKNL